MAIPIYFNGPEDLERLARIGDGGRYDVHITRIFSFRKVKRSMRILVSRLLLLPTFITRPPHLQLTMTLLAALVSSGSM